MADLKRGLKHLMGAAVYRLGLHRRLLRGRGVIVLFHRISAAGERDPITCTAQDFEAFVAFFARHFEVIPLGEFLDRLSAGDDLGGSLAITFDDGYLDNREVAAPILKRHGLPACFFVASGLIGSSRIPAWDEEWGVRSEWMGWPQVRELLGMGFEVGAHTVNHVDLGQVHGDEARAEVRRSRQDLERELGQAVDLFSYPFGREDQITEENREEVRKAGFRCCVSAFGGLVEPGADPFRVRRVPVSPWHRFPYQLGWELLFNHD